MIKGEPVCPLCGAPAVDMPQGMLQVADLEIEGIVVRRAGNAIRLTPTEYWLLLYLAKNANKCVTRRMIEEHSWRFGHQYSGLTNHIDVYIAYLRRKIDDFHETKLIHTVRGYGYMLGDKNGLGRLGL